MRTFTRSDLDAARAAWQDFSHEWCEYRYEAAAVGILYPPSGSRWDEWTDPQPTQRAILIRAIRETPDAVHRAIAGATSWSGVIGAVLQERDAMAAAVREPRARPVRRKRGMPTATRELLRAWSEST